MGLEYVNDLFYINELSGEICTDHIFDRECASQYKFKVFAKDFGNLTGLPVIVEVNIKDLNDNAPIFYQQGILNKEKDLSQSNNLNCNSNKHSRKIAPHSSAHEHAVPQFFLEENSPPHTFIAWLKAYDLDFEANALIDYTLEILNSNETNLFNIDSNGIIRSEPMATENYQHSNYSLKVVVKDRGQSSLSSFMLVNVKIINKLDQMNGISIDLEPDKQVFIVDKKQRCALLNINFKKQYKMCYV